MRNFLVALLLLPSISHAQSWQWGRGNTGAAMDSWPVATDPSGNVFVAGMNFSGNGAAFQPAKFGSYSVPFLIDTNFAYQAIISKYDANGNFLWAEGVQTGNTFPINIAVDQSGSSLLFGAINSPTVTIGSVVLTNKLYPEAQYFLAKFDPSGNVLWAITEGNATDAPADVGNAIYVLGTGGISTDAANNIYITTNFHLRSIKIGSYTLHNADTSGKTDDILVVKYDPSGNVVWATKSGGSGSDDAFGLTVTPAGNIYIAGVFRSPSVAFGPSTILNGSDTLQNAFIAEYNFSGAPIWANSSGGTGGEFAVGIASDESDNIYLTGGLIDTSIRFGDTVIKNPYRGICVLYLAKFDSSNKVNWYKTIGDSTNVGTWGYSIAMSPCGAIWVSGAFSDVLDSILLGHSEVNIDGHILHAPVGSVDPVFIAGFNTAGNYVGSAALQSGADDQNGIACDAQGDVYLCADYYYTCSPFVVGKDTLTDISVSGIVEWQYLAKYTFVDISNPDTLYARKDTAVCTYAGLKLSAPKGYSSYLWQNGSTDTTIPINAAGTYWVVGAGGCTIIDSITVKDNESCPCEVVLPNAFTPNNDGRDDYFQPLFKTDCIVTNYAFSIYNRWGQRVFYSENPTAKWNGTFMGVKAEIGTYMYHLTYNSGPKNTPHATKGDVTLIR